MSGERYHRPITESEYNRLLRDAMYATPEWERATSSKSERAALLERLNARLAESVRDAEQTNNE